jgi:hypothetical protein
MYNKPTTRAQREAVLRLFRRDFPNWSPTFRLDPQTNRKVKVPTLQYRRFRKRFRWYLMIISVLNGAACS